MANDVNKITRDQLAKFLPDNDTIRRFEALFQTAGTTTPANIDIVFVRLDEVTIATATAAADAVVANDLINRVSQALDLLALAPPPEPYVNEGNLAPPVSVGTLGEQQADHAVITGGSANGMSLGIVVPAAASVTTLAASSLVDLSAAGAGQVKFPATQNPSADANTLDDYEKGTWTPTLSFATPGDLAVAYNIREGFYTKIGRLVTLSYTIVTSSFAYTTASGGALIDGVPFLLGAPTRAGEAIYVFQGITKAAYSQFSVSLLPAATSLQVIASGSGQVPDNVTTLNMLTGSSVILSGSLSYIV